MPLHAEDKAIAPGIFRGFNQAVTGPCRRDQLPAQRLDRLVMMTVNHGIERAGNI